MFNAQMGINAEVCATCLFMFVSRESADLVSPSDRQESRCVQPHRQQPRRRTTPSCQNPPSGKEPLCTGEEQTHEVLQVHKKWTDPVSIYVRNSIHFKFVGTTL